MISISYKKAGMQEYSEINAAELNIETKCSEGKYPEEISISITAKEEFAGVIRFAMKAASQDPADLRFFLPGFMYGTNRGEAPLTVDSKTPCMRLKEDFPASPWWMVRSDRLSHPLALVYSGGRVKGFSASPYYLDSEGSTQPWYPDVKGEFYQYAGFGCSLEKGEVWYSLGYENAPYMFVDSHKYFPAKELSDVNSFHINKAETVSFTLYCFDHEAEDERGIQDALKWTYDKFHEEPRSCRSVQETVSDLATAISQDAWLPENHCYAGFVFDKGDHYEYRPLPSISWTNGLSAAVPMLCSAHRLNDETMRLQTLECIDHIVDTSLNKKNGLPYTAEQDGVWSNHGWWYNKQPAPGHAAYLVGQSVYLILKAYVLEKEKGTEHQSWLSFCKGVIEQTEKSRNADGEYPYILSDKSCAGLDYDSLSGAWCLAAAAYYSYITGEKSYLPAMLKSEARYHEAYIKHQECYGGPLDIDKKTDSEGILSYIRAVRYLHEIVDDKENKELLLDHMKDALYYEYTFKFCYNSPVKVPPLSKVGWSSCGGSITSVTNPHIHPMSSSVIDEMYHYLKFRDDEYIRSRLRDTILWSCQCHNTFDKEYDYGKTGWMSERFCHSEGLLTEHYPDGSVASTWFALMPWASGSILEGLTGMAYESKNDR